MGKRDILKTSGNILKLVNKKRQLSDKVLKYNPWIFWEAFIAYGLD